MVNTLALAPVSAIRANLPSPVSGPVIKQQAQITYQRAPGAQPLLPLACCPFLPNAFQLPLEKAGSWNLADMSVPLERQSQARIATVFARPAPQQ